MTQEMKEHIIDKPGLVFDYAFPIFQDLIEERRIKVRIAPVKEAISIFVDVSSFIYRFYKDAAINLHCEGAEHDGFETFRRKKVDKFIEAFVDDSVRFKPYTPKNTYEISKIHPLMDYFSALSVASSSITKCKTKEFKLDSFLGKKFDLKPENKITLSFCKHTDFETRLYLKYQKEDAVSEKPGHHFVSEKARKIMEKIIFYNDRSVISSIAMDIMSGKDTIEDRIMQIYPDPKQIEKEEEILHRRRELKERIERALLVVPYFIYGISKGKNSYEICRDYELVPLEYSRLYASQIMNAVHSIMHDPSRFLKLISSYNIFIKNEKRNFQDYKRILDIKKNIKILRKITVEEFLKGATKVFD